MLKTIATSVVIGGTIGKSYYQATSKASQQARTLGSAFKETNKQLDATKRVTKYKSLIGELTKKQKAAGGSNKRLAAGLDAVEKEYRKAKKEAKSYGIQIGDVVRQQKKLEKQSKRLNKQLKAQSRANAAKGKFNAMKGQMLGSTAALYGAGRLFGDAADHEESGLYLRSVLNADDKDAALGKSMKHAREFAKNSLADESEILEIEYGFNSAGLDADISRMATETAHKVSKVTKGDSSVVSEIIGTTFNNLGESLAGTDTQKLEQIGNILTKTQLKYQIRDFAQLGESMKYGASAAANYKVPLADTAAIIGQLNSAGLQGSMAGTAFNSVLKGMGKASDELGFSIVRTKDGQLDMISTLDNLRGSLEGLDTDQRAATLQKLFGDDGTKGIVPLLDGFDKLKSGVKEVSDASGSGLLDEEYQRFVKSTSGQFKMLGQNVAMVGRVFVETLLPAANAVISPIGKVAGWVVGMLQKFPVLSWALGSVAAGFIAVGTVLGVATAATWLFNTAVAANPIGIVTLAIIGGVVAIGTAVSLLWRNWDSVWGWMKDKALWVWKQIKRTFMWSPIGLIIQGFGKAFSWLEESSEGTKNKVSFVWKGIKTIFKWTPIGIIVQGFRRAFNWIKGHTALIKEKIAVIWRGIKTVFRWSPIGLVVQAFGKAFTWIKNHSEAIKKKIGVIWRSVKAIFKWTPIGIIVQGFGRAFNWISENSNAIKNKISATWEKLKSIFIWNPSNFIIKHWNKAFTWIKESSESIKDKIVETWEHIKTVFIWNPISSVTQRFGKTFSWIKDKFSFLGNAISSVREKLETVFSCSPLDLVIKEWGKAFNWIESKFTTLEKTVGKIKNIFNKEATENDSQRTNTKIKDQSDRWEWLPWNRKEKKIPGLKETMPRSSNQSDNRQDNRQTTVIVQTNDPEEAGKAVSKVIDSSPASYEIPLADTAFA